MKISAFVSGIALTCLACSFTPAQANEINQRVANAYNDGIVRCSNPECARYLYACFQSFRSATLNEFLTCGSLASRLNNDQLVVAPAGNATAQNLR